MNKYLLGFTFCILAPSLYADPPRYPVEKYCKSVADISGGSAMIFNGCIEMEQSSYNVLKTNWDRYAAQSRSYCAEVAQFSGGSYSILEGCIEMEEGARGNTSTFQY
ncbi:hypothetical protein ACG74X_08360 [Marivita sp. S0852]|uniref:hypothetical protein n=1 Tax=Marivita sp. S0852 TaxID=3373893 RepID=UPI0039821E4E